MCVCIRLMNLYLGWVTLHLVLLHCLCCPPIHRYYPSYQISCDAITSCAKISLTLLNHYWCLWVCYQLLWWLPVPLLLLLSLTCYPVCVSAPFVPVRKASICGALTVLGAWLLWVKRKFCLWVLFTPPPFSPNALLTEMLYTLL